MPDSHRSVPDVLRYGTQAADALPHAHAHGVIHRDFKAGNAIVAGERLKIVDFGLARRSDRFISEATTAVSVIPAGAAAGTPYAMAPEQVPGGVADARTDIWALVMLHEMAVGGRPFEGDTVPELFSSILRGDPRLLPPSVPAALRRVLARCLMKDPPHRRGPDDPRPAWGGAGTDGRRFVSDDDSEEIGARRPSRDILGNTGRADASALPLCLRLSRLAARTNSLHQLPHALACLLGHHDRNRRGDGAPRRTIGTHGQ
jgi:serine/threonine protein kinase